MSERVDLVRVAGIVGASLALVSLLGLGWLWYADRHQVLEEPRWERTQFIVLRDRSRAPGDTAETWVVAYNPGCSHCRNSAERTVGRRDATTPRPRLALLFIDTEREQAEVPPARWAVDQLYWDARNVWRRRWGHRVYGEVLRFDVNGHYRGGLSLDAAAQQGPPTP